MYKINWTRQESLFARHNRTYLHFRSTTGNPLRLSMLRSFPVSVDNTVRSGGSWTAARMPDRGALQVHLLSVAERVAAFCATRTGRVEMMVVTRLQNFTADKAVAVGALNPELLLVVLLAVRHAVPVAKRIFVKARLQKFEFDNVYLLTHSMRTTISPLASS